MCFMSSFGSLPVTQEDLLLLSLLRCLYKYFFFIIILQFLALFYGAGY